MRVLRALTDAQRRRVLDRHLEDPRRQEKAAPYLFLVEDPVLWERAIAIIVGKEFWYGSEVAIGFGMLPLATLPFITGARSRLENKRGLEALDQAALLCIARAVERGEAMHGLLEVAPLLKAGSVEEVEAGLRGLADPRTWIEWLLRRGGGSKRGISAVAMRPIRPKRRGRGIRVGLGPSRMDNRMMLTRLTTLACTLTALTVTGAIADAAPSLKLGKPKVTRGDKYITDDALLTTVAPDADGTGVGGITGDELRIAGCTDFTSGTLASWEGKKIDAGGGIVIEITAIEEAGTSKRGQPGNHCGFKIFDRATPSLYAEIPLAGVPRFTAPTGVLREGDKVYVNLNFNGYAKEIDAANFIVALDLAAHQELWRTPKFTSNAAMLAVDDVIITGYGFTKEKASLNVIDTATGKVAQKVALPKAPSQIVRKGDTLFVRIYDGYATIPMTRAKR